MKCDELYAAGLISFAVLFTGCTGSSVSVSDVSQNPEEYLGQTIKLTGQITKKEPEHSSLQRFDVSNRSLNQGLQAVTASKRIGTVDGSIELTGSCRQNTYASKVKVEGQVKTYTSCDCETNSQYIEEEKKDAIFLIYEGRGAVELTRENWDNKLLSRDYVDSKEALRQNLMDIKSRSDFERIDAQIPEDLSEKLDLRYFFDNSYSERLEHFSGTVDYKSNGQPGDYNKVDKTGYAPDGKYTLRKSFLVIRNYKPINRTKYSDEEFISEAPSGACKPGSQFVRSTGDREYRNHTVEGCSSEPEKKYYFSCDNVVEQIN